MNQLKEEMASNNSVQMQTAMHFYKACELRKVFTFLGAGVVVIL
jgi:hypothetical protein